jgi:hypothetical protein
MPVRRIALALLPFLAAPALCAQAAPTPRDTLALARQYTTWFYSGQADSLVAHSDSATRALPDAKDRYEDAFLQLTMHGGQEVSVVEEKFVKRLGHTQYWRTANFSAYTAEPVQVRWAVNEKWEIIGLGLNPLSQAPPVDSQ